jgi:Flp pilus assembly protein TadD
VRNWRNSITLMEHMVREAPRSVKWLNQTCYTLYRSGKISREQAAAYVERSLSVLSEYAPTRVAAAFIAMEYDNPQMALAQLKRAEQLDPKGKEVASAWCAFNAKSNPEEALERCTKAVQLKPRDPRNWGLLAVALDKNNEPDKAAETFQKAFETMSVPDYGVYANYGVFLVKRGQMSQARSVFEFVVENNPNDRDTRKFLEKMNSRFPVQKLE